MTRYRVGPLTAWLAPSAFPAQPGFLNGIVSTVDGRLALVSDQATERLYRLDLAARTVTQVALTGGTLAADGLLLDGDRLYGVVNVDKPNGGVSFVVRLARLSADDTAGTVIADSDPDSEAQSPTTLARDDHGRLLWVNSQLAASTPAPPYTVTEGDGLR